MKKIVMLAIIGMILNLFACKDDQGNELNPLFLLSNCVGDKTITVKATYNGSEPTSSIGTKQIYVYLFRSLGLSARDPQPAYMGSTAGEVSAGTEYTITIENVCDGDYYVMIAYDYRSGDAGIFDNRTDRYVLYGGAGHSGFASLAAEIAVSGDMELNPVAFDDTYQLASGSVYMRPCTLTVNATYNGADYNTAIEPGSGRLFVYLYDSSLGADTRTPTPKWAGSTSLPATIGAETTINLSNITSGNYYVLLFYDYSDEVGHYDSEADRYLLYNGGSGTQLAGLATTVTLSDGGSQTWDDVAFGNDYTLQTGSAYMTLPADLDVNVTYSGSLVSTGTGQVYVYLYNNRPDYGSRRPYAPVYTASAAAVAPGTPVTVTFTDIDQGDYYVLALFDYKLGTDETPDNTDIDSPEDRYVLYSASGNVGSPGSATTYSLTGNQTLNLDPFEDDYTFQTNVLSNALFMQSGSLTVHATYTGSEPTENVGSRYLYVYLYESLGTGPHAAGSLPIYSTSTGGAVDVGTEYAMTINNVLPGNYYVFVYYDFRSGSGTTPANQTDRYVLYNGVPYTSTASTFSVSTGSDLPGVSFGDDFLVQGGTLFMVP